VAAQSGTGLAETVEALPLRRYASGENRGFKAFSTGVQRKVKKSKKPLYMDAEKKRKGLWSFT